MSSVAVIFDSAGTLLNTYRIAKDIRKGKLMPGVETTMLTFASPDRVLVVVHIHSQEMIDAPPEMLLSEYLVRNRIGFGVSCTRKITTADEIGDILYHDRHAHISDLQECIRNVWSVCRKESVITINSGVIINMALPGIEFTVTTGGSPFPGAKDTVTLLHQMGIATYIASGDRVTKLERMADFLGIPRDRVNGFATPAIKAQIVADLKCEYDTVVMVGDSINDLCAMRAADVSILSLEQGGERPEELSIASDFVIRDVREVAGIVKELKETGGDPGEGSPVRCGVADNCRNSAPRK
ncbi:MAG: HAD family hydrolase [Methanoregulaceae archaeon]|nr:HAD family hydrolase [Methanoregulaceae archaeon]